MNRFAVSQTTLSKRADEVNFVLPRCERIPLSVQTSECFLSVDRSGKRVAWLAFDEFLCLNLIIVWVTVTSEDVYVEAYETLSS